MKREFFYKAGKKNREVNGVIGIVVTHMGTYINYMS